jgi:photosystem II stability/assembly factor-like uncharacterized protein
MTPVFACLSCNGATVTSSDRPADRLHVATVRGIVTLKRAAEGAPWPIAAEALCDRHVSALLLEPRTGKLFAAAHHDGGIAVSDDDGATWRDASRGLAQRHVYTLALQQRGDQTVLFAGVEPAAIYRSDDLGYSWRELPALRDVPKTELWNFPPPPYLAHVKNIAFDPSAPATIYVSVEQGALLKTVDDGASWVELESYEDTSEDRFRHDIHRVLVKPSDPSWLFMLTGDGTYRSRDAGADWEHTTNRAHTIGYPDAGFIDPRDENILFIGGPKNSPRLWGTERCANATVMRSDDGGTTWRECRAGLPAMIVGNIEAMGMHHAGKHVMLSAGTATGEVFVSDDAGLHWSTAATGLAPISKGGHYRWFLSDDERADIERRMRSAAPVST